MDNDLLDLYQDIILDHNKRPRNFGVLANATHHAEGNNPLCGDEVEVFLRLEGDRVAEVTFKGEGCAISRASASLMTLALKGKTLAEVRASHAEVLEMLTRADAPEVGLDTVGDLAALSGVRRFPARIKCATLAWHTCDAALTGGGKISTEDPKA